MTENNTPTRNPLLWAEDLAAFQSADRAVVEALKEDPRMVRGRTQQLVEVRRIAFELFKASGTRQVNGETVLAITIPTGVQVVVPEAEPIRVIFNREG